MNRTFSDTNVFFLNGTAQKAITDVLKAVSLAIPEVGYTQGMNFLATFFVLNLSDEDSFWMFIYLFEKRHLKSVFIDLNHLGKYYFTFGKLQKKFLPKIQNHLVKIPKPNTLGGE